jgi:hypothetical protein
VINIVGKILGVLTAWADCWVRYRDTNSQCSIRKCQNADERPAHKITAIDRIVVGDPASKYIDPEDRESTMGNGIIVGVGKLR